MAWRRPERSTRRRNHRLFSAPLVVQAGVSRPSPTRTPTWTASWPTPRSAALGSDKYVATVSDYVAVTNKAEADLAAARRARAATTLSAAGTRPGMGRAHGVAGADDESGRGLARPEAALRAMLPHRGTLRCRRRTAPPSTPPVRQLPERTCCEVGVPAAQRRDTSDAARVGEMAWRAPLVIRRGRQASATSTERAPQTLDACSGAPVTRPGSRRCRSRW